MFGVWELYIPSYRSEKVNPVQGSEGSSERVRGVEPERRWETPTRAELWNVE